jgi:hypothetical protein
MFDIKSSCTAKLIKCHKSKLYPLIINQSCKSPGIIEEVCEALMDLECQQFISSALPQVILMIGGFIQLFRL